MRFKTDLIKFVSLFLAVVSIVPVAALPTTAVKTTAGIFY